ncbi:conserved hypothetical protein [Paenibacillus curdlanolyticus YK9]|uniref:DUF2568 domain-containing protein n=1 Tax=Paenibacillus curdlanolyticus YK9 TaxID=717606 RepID=E0I8Z2_9BACL|nr:YrdB family protein [Paenibacillus curdlanolyticus]EFM10876.1 conserved hypothetical protein [Paenibacillus curdlanolyticus YK9]
MAILLMINLGLTFILELLAVAALGYWGFHAGSNLPLRLLLGIGAPVLMIFVWGTYLAPKASIPIEGAWKTLMIVIVFALAALALYAAGHPRAAVWFFVIFLLNFIINALAGQ